MKNILLLTASVIIMFGLIEMCLRRNDRSHAVLTWSSILLNGTTYRFLEEEEAFRDAARAVVFVGDSFTAGIKCGNRRNFPGQVREILREEEQAITTLNLGIRDTGPFSYLTRIKDFLSTYTASLVVVALYANDIELDPAMCHYTERMTQDRTFTEGDVAQIVSYCEHVGVGNRYANFSRGRFVHEWLLFRSHTYRLVREGLLRILVSLDYDIGWGRAHYPVKWAEHDGLNFKLLSFSLKELTKVAERHHVPLMIVLYPDVSVLSPESPSIEMLQPVAHTLARQLDVPVYSGDDAFLSRKDLPASMDWSLTDHHPNCDAHRIFSEWIVTKFPPQLFPQHDPARHRDGE